MFVLGLFPFLDIVSDMIYILSIKFWSFELFICAIVFFVVPSSMFVYKLIKMRAYPRLIQFVGVEVMQDQYIWLSVSPEGSPLINGQRSSLSYQEHDGIEKLVWFWVLWALLVSFQAVFLVLCLIWYSFASVLLLAWLFAGLFLYQTKMLAIGKVWNTWFYTWTQSTDYHKEISLDASVLNESLFHEFILETVPQIAIQSINNSLIYNGNFPAISLFSLAMSIFIAINGIYRYGYYLLWKGIKFDEIPLPLAVRMQKINKKLLPRRSMISRKLNSLIESVKISDESILKKSLSGKILPADTSTPHGDMAAVIYHMEIVINKLQAMQGVSSNEYSNNEHRHKYEELVVTLRNVHRMYLSEVSKCTYFNHDFDDVNSNDNEHSSSNPAIAIDIDIMIRRAMSMRSNKVQPITEVTRDSPQEKGGLERRDVTSEMKRNNEDYDTFGKEEVRQVEGVGAESRAATHLETFDELEDDSSLEYSDNGSDYSI
jgi:hypothetical protein